MLRAVLQLTVTYPNVRSVFHTTFCRSFQQLVFASAPTSNLYNLQQEPSPRKAAAFLPALISKGKHTQVLAVLVYQGTYYTKNTKYLLSFSPSPPTNCRSHANAIRRSAARTRLSPAAMQAHVLHTQTKYTNTSRSAVSNGFSFSFLSHIISGRLPHLHFPPHPLPRALRESWSLRTSGLTSHAVCSRQRKKIVPRPTSTDLPKLKIDDTLLCNTLQAQKGGVQRWSEL